jgi:cathepsin L
MQKILAFIFLFSIVSPMAFGMKDTIALHLWNQFKKTHEKSYEEKVDMYRFELFRKNMDLIEKHNDDYEKGVYTYRLGVNQFADWTVEEFRNKMLGTRMNMSLNRQGSTSRHLRLPKGIQLPDSVDWREQGAVTPVKNQGQCGSCWAFSTTGSLEGAHFRSTGQLVSLSEQQLVDCSSKYNNEGCNGGLMDNAFKYVKENGGIDTEESYPYHAKQEKCKFNKNTIGATCSGYVDVESGNEEALHEAVATIGPVSVAIDVTEERFMLYKDGIFVDSTCSNGEDDLNHGVLVVGYGTNVTDHGKQQDYWIVKNSWSTRWGESGYIRMARNLNNMCGIATAASYPLVKETRDN